MSRLANARARKSVHNAYMTFVLPPEASPPRRSKGMQGIIKLHQLFRRSVLDGEYKSCSEYSFITDSKYTSSSSCPFWKLSLTEHFYPQPIVSKFTHPSIYLI